MLSKACLVGIYQRKLEEIAKHTAVTSLKVLVPPYWKDERGITPLERAHVTGYELEVTPMRFNGSFHLHYYPQFGQVARAFRPDIVHIDEEPYNVATWLALRAAQQVGAKTLFFSWQNIERSYPPPFRWGEKWVLRQVDYALVGTHSAADIWRAKGYRGKLAVIPQFGVDPELFAPQPRPHAEFTIGYIGRLVREKGVDLLLEALATVLDCRWRLKIIGGGPEEAALRNQAERLKLANRVTFVGQVPSMQMPDHFAQLDILVIPSRTLPNWKEQFGRVIVEAMASGVCVIGSDSGAIPDVIGDAGLIFPEENSAALADKVRQLIADDRLRQALARQGRERILQHFTQAQIAAQTVAVYQDMLNG